MMKKIRWKKKRIFKLFLSVVLIIFLCLLLDQRSYTIKYKVNNVQVIETYDKSENLYYIDLNYKNKNYQYVVKNYAKRKIVKNFDYYRSDNTQCLALDLVDNTKTDAFCYKDKELISINLAADDIKEHYHINEKEKDSANKTFENINIYSTDNRTYLFYNYDNFLLINGNERVVIDNDMDNLYTLKLASKVKNYVIFADLTNEYYFKRFYIINLKNKKISKWDLDVQISSDSYILGTNNDSIFLFDRKENKEYEFVPEYKKLRIVSKKDKAKVYNNGKLESISINKLKNSKYQFSHINVYNYQVIENNLYMRFLKSKYNIRISDKKDVKIVDVLGKDVYYLSEDNLYKFDGQKEILMFSNFEWNFNTTNMIFIY